MQSAHLAQQLAHILCTRARSRLVRHCADPLHHVVLEQAAQAHEHQAHGAVAADPVFAAFAQRAVDDVAVDGVQDDHGVVGHAQARGCVNPVAVPARCAQLGVHLFGVVAALAGDDDFAALQRVNVVGVLERGFVFSLRRGFATCVRRGEEHGFDQIEILLLNHAVDQHRADHAAPTD